MSTTSSDIDFLTALKKSGLLTEQALQKFVTSFPDLVGHADKMATAMIRQGLLTPFQARQLLTGKYRGLQMGPYKLLEHLGTGGMGAIFLAEHTSLNRRVAIKVLPVDKAKNQELLQRFYREARAAAALDHRNIVRLFDITQGAGTHFLVMEYVPGQTLRQMISATGPIHYQQAVQYIVQTATGLLHAHQKGFVHRDIKPDNIMLSKEGIIKILDMGLARSLHDELDNVTKMMNPNAIYGSVDYISPEQSIGGTVDARSDLYSLGATLFALITGMAPFSGTSAQILVSHQLAEVPKLDQFRTAAPAQLNAVIAKLMAKQPERRYQNAAEVINALSPWMPAEQHLQTMVAAPALTIEQVRKSTTTQLTKPIKTPTGKIQTEVKQRGIPPWVALVLVIVGIGIAAVVLVIMVISSGDSSPSSLPIAVTIDPPSRGSGTSTPTKANTGNSNSNYVSKNPLTNVNQSNCICLSLKSVVNVISSRNLFSADPRSEITDSLTLPAWGRRKYHGVPFELIDPQGTSVPNILLFQGGDTPFTQGRPTSAIIPCHHSAKVIHILGGISGWAYPHNPDRTVVLIARLHYQNGEREEHELVNGTHFADWRMPQANVPTAPVVAQLDKERHLRYISITPKRREEIKEIELIKGDNERAAPMFFAITIEH